MRWTDRKKNSDTRDASRCRVHGYLPDFPQLSDHPYFLTLPEQRTIPRTNRKGHLPTETNN